MEIKQFEHEPLSHYSYVIISQGKMAVVDPERDPMKYYKFAEEHKARIVAVFETHPHADFVSSHLQIHNETGATIYTSNKTGAEYPHQAFDEGDRFTMGAVTFSVRNTPGHSPDSITIIASEGEHYALFTGDTLFIGDVGRPDLREKAGHLKAKRQELAEAMYHTIRDKFSDLPDHAFVYPAHGAGSLCGKGMSADSSTSTLGNERIGNWAFKKQTEETFVTHLLDSQPFIPHYFGYDVEINKNGALNLQKSIGNIPFEIFISEKEGNPLIVDIRDEKTFKKGHLPGSINIMAVSETSKFETWLGSIIRPEEKFYLVVDTITNAASILKRIAYIGYETQVISVLTLSDNPLAPSPDIDLNDFEKNPEQYTILDIRNKSEVDEGKIFESALAIPLHELREQAGSIPKDKPIVVHCAAGYRSAAGSSILEKEMSSITVFDLSDNIKKFSEGS